MKRLIIFLGIVASAVSASAQFAIDWFTIDGGGGSSSNSTYVISGTIGQPDASGSQTGVMFAVQGGFWPGVQAVQTPGAPFLFVTRSGGNVLLSWAPETPGFVLQQSTTMTTGSWQNAPSGPTNPVAIPPGALPRFYRLLKP